MEICFTTELPSFWIRCREFCNCDSVYKFLSSFQPSLRERHKTIFWNIYSTLTLFLPALLLMPETLPVEGIHRLFMNSACFWTNVFWHHTQKNLQTSHTTLKCSRVTETEIKQNKLQQSTSSFLLHVRITNPVSCYVFGLCPWNTMTFLTSQRYWAVATAISFIILQS